MSANLPDGFVLDQPAPAASLPAGFVLDKAPTAAPAAPVEHYGLDDSEDDRFAAIKAQQAQPAGVLPNKNAPESSWLETGLDTMKQVPASFQKAVGGIREFIGHANVPEDKAFNDHLIKLGQDTVAAATATLQANAPNVVAGSGKDWANKLGLGIAQTIPAMGASFVTGSAMPLIAQAGGTSFGNTYADEITKNPNDPDGAATKATAVGVVNAAATAIGIKAFGIQPFTSAVGKITNEATGEFATVYQQTIGDMIKNVMVQGVAIQPAISVVNSAVDNWINGKPITEGLSDAYVTGAIQNTLVMGITHLATRPPPTMGKVQGGEPGPGFGEGPIIDGNVTPPGRGPAPAGGWGQAALKLGANVEINGARIDPRDIHEGDAESPIDTSIIAAGRKIQREAIQKQAQASESAGVLARNGLPSAGTRVTLDDGEQAPLTGTVHSGYSEPHPDVPGAMADGIQVQLDSGDMLRGFKHDLDAAGITITPQQAQQAGLPLDVATQPTNQPQPQTVAATPPPAATATQPEIAPAQVAPQPVSADAEITPPILRTAPETTGDGTQSAPIVVTHPDHLATAEANVNTSPTEAQAAAGNYQLGHAKIQGLDIAIENPKGSIRRGVDADGKPWEVALPASYGYIKRSTAADGEQVDAYVGPNPQSSKVFVIDQKDAKTGAYDEAKSFIGFDTKQQVLDTYHAAFSDGLGPQRMGGVREMNTIQFKQLLNSGVLDKPVAGGKESTTAGSSGAGIYTAPDEVSPPKAILKTPRAPLAPSTETSVLENIRRMGGIKTTDANGQPTKEGQDIQAVLKDVNRPGLINNQTGQRPDTIREHMQQHGWFGQTGGHDIQDLYDLIDKETRNGPQFHPESERGKAVAAKAEAESSERARADAHAELDHFIKESKELFSTADKAALHEQVDGGFDPLSAVVEHIERRAMREQYEHHAETADQDYAASLEPDRERAGEVAGGSGESVEGHAPVATSEGNRDEAGDTTAPSVGAPSEARKGEVKAEKPAFQHRDEPPGMFDTEPGTAVDGQGNVVPQTVIPGARGDAVQLAKAREAAGKGKSTTSVKQKAAGGLFGGDEPTEPEQGALFQHRQDEAPFFSALTRGVEGLKMEKAPPGQWEATIKNLPGIKQEELDWSGLKEWLGQQARPVTKAEVLQHLRGNEVQVQEVEKQAPKHPQMEDAHLLYDTPRGQTKYQSYVLPGGENYRELLLTLPENGDAISRSADERGTTYRTEAERQNFRSSHFDEPNILAHVRFDDRTGPNGEKVLHVAEIQSDWHQKGRRSGYRGPVDEAALLKKSHAALEATYAIRDRKASEISGGRFTDELQARNAGDTATAERIKDIYKDPEFLAAMKVRDDLVEEMSAARTAVPDAPFKTSWQELAAKRMLRYAAEHGYDRLSWDTGETQAARYDLSKQVDRIEYFKNTDGKTFDVSAWKDGAKVMAVPSATEASLEGYVGKDVAKRIVDGEGLDADGVGTLSGDNLKIGGEGMKGFYDRILPNFLNKYAKKWGAKVEQSTTATATPRETYKGPTPTKEQIQAVSDATRARASDQRFISPITGERLEYQINRVSNESALRDVLKEMEQGKTFAEAMADHGSDDLAKIFGGEKVRSSQRGEAPSHSLAITPAMRESVMQGQPLFQKGNGPAPAPGAREEIYPGVNLVTSPEFAAQRASLASDMRKWLDARNLHDVGVRVADAIENMDAGTLRQEDGVYLAKIINLALSAKDPSSVMPHEVIHALRRMGFISKPEWAILVREAKAKWLERYADKLKGYTDAEKIEEAVAFAHQEFAAGRPTRFAILNRIFSRIRDALNKIRSAFAGRGLRAPEDVFGTDARKIFEGIESGKVGKRGPGFDRREEPAFQHREGEPTDDHQAAIDNAWDTLISSTAKRMGWEGEPTSQAMGLKALLMPKGPAKTELARNARAIKALEDQRSNPLGTRQAPIQGDGETKVRGAAQSLADKAAKSGHTLEDLPSYDVSHQAPFIERSEKFDAIPANRGISEAVAMGIEPPPHGTTAESMLIAVQNRATREGDAALLLKLATQSKVLSDLTTAGQRISMMQNLDPNSPVANIKTIQTARATAAKVKGGDIPKAKKDTIKDMMDTINKRSKQNAKGEPMGAAARKLRFKMFLNSVVCK